MDEEEKAGGGRLFEAACQYGMPKIGEADNSRA